MEQFRQVGEVVGGLKALMVLKHEIAINQRQCSLLYDMLLLAFHTISEEIKQNLRLENRSIKWKALEFPLKELHRVFKEADLYIRHCMDVKDWWGKAISLHMNRDCVEFHIHNLLSCFPVVIEAIETAAEISGVDEEDMQKRRAALMKKYDEEYNDPKFFQWKFGKQYLVPQEICNRLEAAWREDRWMLLEKVLEKKMANLTKHEQRLAELLLRKLNYGETSKEKFLPSHALVGAHDYYVKRRLGCQSGGGHFKEIHWLGETFALRTFFGDIDPLYHEISSVLSLSHPNVLQYFCAFYDEDRKEGFLVMELMNKDLESYIKENYGQRKRIPLPIPVAVDIMLQIARGMEYLHSRKIYHGDLNPSKILLKPRNASVGGALFHAKVSGFGLASIKNYGPKSPKPNTDGLDIWLAPEVLAELEQPGGKNTAKYTEKADVYSFAMLSFELLNGKVPFEDGHLQGEKMVRNIRAGERPLFSYPSPKYLTNLTKKCWQTNPNLRPSFKSICRILRYIKKNIVINPDHGHPDSPPMFVDYCDMEAAYLKKFPEEGTGEIVGSLSRIPFQMFAYKLVEKEKFCGKNWDLAAEGSRPASLFDDEHLSAMDDLFLAPSDRRSVCSEIIDRKCSAMDMRSVISEISHRKLFPFDQRSFGSESPRKRFYSTPPPDQRAETPERKMDQGSPTVQAIEKKIDQHIKKLGMVQLPDKATIVSKVTECQSASSPGKPPQENRNKSSSNKATEQKPEAAEVLNKQTSSESSDGKISSLATGYKRLPEIPEKKILKNEESTQKMVSVTSETSEKKIVSASNTSEPSGNPESSVRKPTLIQKLKDKIITGFQETKKNDSTRSSPSRMRKTNRLSPASSPARTMKLNPWVSPASSPARVKKTSPGLSPARAKKTNPGLSPARTKKMNPGLSPASSPARVKKTNAIASPASSPSRPPFITCASPKRTPACALKECSSPMHPPLNPCGRCSRLGRQSSLPISKHNVGPQ